MISTLFRALKGEITALLGAVEIGDLQTPDLAAELAGFRRQDLREGAHLAQTGEAKAFALAVEQQLAQSRGIGEKVVGLLAPKPLRLLLDLAGDVQRGRRAGIEDAPGRVAPVSRFQARRIVGFAIGQ